MTQAMNQPIQVEPKLSGDVHDAATELRAAFADLVGALPGAPSSAIDVERTLGINKKLAWQVYRTATSPQPLDVGARSPGQTAMKRVTDAASKLGIDPVITTRLKRAAERFNETVARHADDRSTFDLMVSSTTGDGLKTREHELKRSDYRTRREILGKYADIHLFTSLITPGDDRDLVNICSIRGLVRLHRLRPDVALEIARHRYDRSDGVIHTREAIDPTESLGDPPIALLREFSSAPLPNLRQEPSAQGFIRTFAETPTLGLQSAVTCILADVVRNTSIAPSPNDPQKLSGVGHIVEIATPAKVLLHDALIDKELWPSSKGVPDLRVLASRTNADRWPADDSSVLLPIQESVVDLGNGRGALSTPELPEYPRMIEHVCSKLGCDPDRFRLMRCRIEFPVVNSVIWMRFDMSDR